MIPFMYVFCLLAWGLNFIAVKIQGAPVSPAVSLTYRIIGSAIMFVILTLIVRPKGRPSFKDIVSCHFRDM